MKRPYIRSRHIKSLENLIASLEQDALNGDKDAPVEKAWAIAFLEITKAGHRVTDLPWFKYTSHYTGGKDKNLDKAA